MSKPPPFVVGLTGGIGSGKSTVANLFAHHGIAIVDTDEIAHALTRAGGAAITAIRQAFGDRFIDPGGAMERREMRELVFSDDGAKKRLEAILHPMIRSECVRMVFAAGSAYVITVVPLLFESGRWRETCNRSLVVDCPEAEQIRRVRLRSGLTEEEVASIMDKQMSRGERNRLADDVIDNGDAQAGLVTHVDLLHRKYLELAAGN